MTERCATCMFWRRDETTVDPNDDSWAFGVCRRRPPVIVEAVLAAIMPAPSYHEQVDPELNLATATTASRQPATHSSDWCGEHELSLKVPL